MLVSGGMEDHVGTVLVEEGVYAVLVPDVGDDELLLHAGCLGAELELHVVHRSLGEVHENQLADRHVDQLAAEFSADRAGTSGDYDHLVGEELADLEDADLDLVAAQQVLYLDLADLVAEDALVECGQRGTHQYLDAALGAELDEVVLLVAGGDIAREYYGRYHAGGDQTGEVPLVVDMVYLVAAQQLALVMGVMGDESGAAVGRVQGLLEKIEGVDRVVVSTVDEGVLDIVVRSRGKGKGTVDIGQQNPHHDQQEEGENHVQDREEQYPVAAEGRCLRIGQEDEERGDVEHSLDDGGERYAPHLPHGGVTYYSGVTLGHQERYQRYECRHPGYGKIVAQADILGREIVEYPQHEHGGDG